MKLQQFREVVVPEAFLPKRRERAIRDVAFRRLSIRPPFSGRRCAAICATTAAQTSEKDLKSEEHKLYDEAVITVRAGRGGDGEAVKRGAGKTVQNYKYNPGRRRGKQIWLSAGAPADGGSGGDVILTCDTAVESLMPFHHKSIYTAKKGPHGNPEDGSQGPKSLSPAKRPKRSALPCHIPVPPGTVVKHKGSGRFMGELLKPGDRLVVARGGRGGYGVVVPSKKRRPRQTKQRRTTVHTLDVDDSDWRVLMRGTAGEEKTLQLLLRVVADVGFVGLPNAGKSALLAALSRAQPRIAPYPFTTLIPNLGVMGNGGDPVLVDLPGLIEGAHVGRGLGRNFLRHLRRTHILLHVVDVSQPNPVADYVTIREELRMYNPQYCVRPHVVALNKIDLVPSSEQLSQTQGRIQAAAEEMQGRLGVVSLPEALVLTSAVGGEGVDELQRILQSLVKSMDDSLKTSGSETRWDFTKPFEEEPEWEHQQ